MIDKLTLRFFLSLGCLLLLGLFNVSGAQEDEDADFLPGILGTYSAGAVSFERIDPDVSFDWGTGSPDERLPQGKFEVEWQSLLLIRKNVPYRFHAFVSGEVEIQINEEVVLKGNSTTPGWISGDEITLPFGEQELLIKYKKTTAHGLVKLFWSSDSFAIEPLPAVQLFRDEPNPHAYHVEQGRKVVEAFRCNSCHQSTTEIAPLAAPSLTKVNQSISSDWLVNKIQNPTHKNRSSKMPDFGFTESEATAVAAYILSQSSSPELVAIPEIAKPKKAKQNAKPVDPLVEGERLVHTVGCLACHQINDLGQADLYSGPELTHLGSKRTADWIYNWLQTPEKLNTKHRMPEVLLSSTEKNQVARYLATLSKAKLGEAKAENVEPPKYSAEQVQRGRKLVETANCLACHEMSKDENLKQATLPALDVVMLQSQKSCLEPFTEKSSKKLPYFNERVNQESLNAYLKTHNNTQPSTYTIGERLLTSKNCLACHQRGTANGLKDLAGLIASNVPGQTGRSEAFVPPSLTAIGDKLRDDVLENAVSGKQDRVRVGWLDVRMPKFAHSAEEKAAFLAYLKGHDRIPAKAPESTIIPQETAQANEEWFLTGQALVGARGFSCIACHQIGDFQPKKVALGTRGTDLKQIGNRMRKEFFFRWVQSPIRIISGMEMPSFNRPKEGVLKGHMPTQLAALWKALNDPRLSVPTDPTVVEQYWAVEPGSAPRILRDVFMVKGDKKSDEKKETPIARSFAVGFDNGHSLLFDMANARLDMWTVGDFARQRTAGKSWFWDMAGNQLARFSAAPDFALLSRNQIHLPIKEGDTTTRLLSYRSGENQVKFNYLIHFEIEKKKYDLHVLETIEKQQSSNSQSGLKRKFVVTDLPAGSELVVTTPKVEKGFGSPTVELISGIPQKTISSALLNSVTKETASRIWTRLVSRKQKIEAVWNYTCSVNSPALQSNLKKPTTQKLKPISTLPGFKGVRLPLDSSIMPTAIAVTASGDLAIVSLKGHVYLAKDTDGDGLEDQLTLFEEGLASPFGIYADGEDILVSHKPEVIRLSDTNGDGRADQRKVVATGWGYTEDYHDWTCGIVKDSKGRFYIGVGSDYAQKTRPDESRKWRGTVMRFTEAGDVEPVGHAFRYPVGFAIDDQDRVFISDQQGVQNTFNEINLLQPGKSYGVLGFKDRKKKIEEARAAIQVPHPWTRSVNGLFMLPKDYPLKQLAGQGVGCEYNGRFLMRFSIDSSNGNVQGASYNLSQPDRLESSENFMGPISGCVGPDGSIYIGSIHDSGWSGGSNTGEIVKLIPTGDFPNGIKSIRSHGDGFEIEFFEPINPKVASDPQQYSISGYTRVWQGAYGTPDSDRHQVKIRNVTVTEGNRHVVLKVDQVKPAFVYEITCGDFDLTETGKLWPATGHYTMNSVPQK